MGAAMAEAFENAHGDLAERMLAALYAAQREGGDARGVMSAALLVVSGTPHDDPHAGVVHNLRVDDHAQPVDELARLLRYNRGFREYEVATEALFGGNAADALQHVDRALELVPGDENMEFLRAGALLFTGQVGDAQAVTRRLIEHRPSWEIVIRGFASKGLLPVPEGVEVDAFVKGP